MRTLIVDDHELIAEGLSAMLWARFGFESVRCCTNGIDALRLAAEDPPELVLQDWHLPSMPHQEALTQALLAAVPQLRVVVVSAETRPSIVRRAIEGGAVGFVPKESPKDVLAEALRLVTRGGVYLPPQLLLPEPPPSGAELRSLDEAFPQLTPRQCELLNLLVRGQSNKQIARAMAISDGTVKQHLNHIFRTLDVGNRTEVVYLLARKGLRFS